MVDIIEVGLEELEDRGTSPLRNVLVVEGEDAVRTVDVSLKHLQQNLLLFLAGAAQIPVKGPRVSVRKMDHGASQCSAVHTPRHTEGGE